jgi:hypothetical protein
MRPGPAGTATLRAGRTKHRRELEAGSFNCVHAAAADTYPRKQVDNDERMETVNVFSAENIEGRIDVARFLGSTATLMFIYDLPPGERQSPYHYEFEEEWLLVVDGTLVRTRPAGTSASVVWATGREVDRNGSHLARSRVPDSSLSAAICTLVESRVA